MGIRIAHPRLFGGITAVLVVLGLTATAAAVLGDDEANGPMLDGGFQPIGSSDQTEPITAEELASAVAAVDEDSRIADITANQELTANDPRAGESAEGQRLIVVDISWEQPVDSTGPWIDLECQNTVAADVEASWVALRSLTVTVSAAEGRVIGFVPGLAAHELGGRFVQLISAPTIECAEGTEDD